MWGNRILSVYFTVTPLHVTSLPAWLYARTVTALERMALSSRTGFTTEPDEFPVALSVAMSKLTLSFTLKPEQRACVKSMFAGRDVFLWLPTGFRKSVCYEVLPFMYDYKLGRDTGSSLVLVISPLVSLMVDQVASLRKRGVKAAIVSSISASGSTISKEFLAQTVDLSSASLLFCALGMGVNLCDVNTVIHYGAPHSIDDYFQESGRGGRSGDDAQSIIYWKPIDCPNKKDVVSIRDREIADVRSYLTTNICRRFWLLNFFDSYFTRLKHDKNTCCDICTIADSW